MKEWKKQKESENERERKNLSLTSIPITVILLMFLFNGDDFWWYWIWFTTHSWHIFVAVVVIVFIRFMFNICINNIYRNDRLRICAIESSKSNIDNKAEESIRKLWFPCFWPIFADERFDWIFTLPNDPNFGGFGAWMVRLYE